MRYNIGDKVKVRLWDDMVEEFGLNDVGNINTVSLSFGGRMAKHCGSTLTIKSKDEDSYRVEETGYYWTDCMFEERVVGTAVETFTIEEVITILRDDPYVRFRPYTDTSNDYITLEGGIIVWRGGANHGQPYKVCLSYPDMSNWIKVEEYYTFQEILDIVKANGIRVKVCVTHDTLDVEYRGYFDDVMEDLANACGPYGLSKVIIEGKWRYTMV